MRFASFIEELRRHALYDVHDAETGCDVPSSPSHLVGRLLPLDWRQWNAQAAQLNGRPALVIR